MLTIEPDGKPVRSRAGLPVELAVMTTPAAIVTLNVPATGLPSSCHRFASDRPPLMVTVVPPATAKGADRARQIPSAAFQVRKNRSSALWVVVRVADDPWSKF